MIADLINYFKNKKILILGFGKEGKSTYNLIRKYLPYQDLYIADSNNKFSEIEGDKNVKLNTGKNYLENLENYDIIMKSPRNFFSKNRYSKNSK